MKKLTPHFIHLSIYDLDHNIDVLCPGRSKEVEKKMKRNFSHQWDPLNQGDRAQASAETEDSQGASFV